MVARGRGEVGLSASRPVIVTGVGAEGSRDEMSVLVWRGGHRLCGVLVSWFEGIGVFEGVFDGWLGWLLGRSLGGGMEGWGGGNHGFGVAWLD